MKKEYFIYSNWMHILVSIPLGMIVILPLSLLKHLHLDVSNPYIGVPFVIYLCIILGSYVMLTVMAPFAGVTWQMILCRHGLWPKPTSKRVGNIITGDYID